MSPKKLNGISKHFYRACNLCFAVIPARTLPFIPHFIQSSVDKIEERITRRRIHICIVTDLSSDTDVKTRMRLHARDLEAGSLYIDIEIIESIGVPSGCDILIAESKRHKSWAEVTTETVRVVVKIETFE